MRVFLKRLRGAFGNAVFWGVVWFVIGLLFLAAQSLRGFVFYLPGLIAQATFAGLLGAITGGIFSAFIAARFSRMQVDDLKARQFALGGVLIGMLAGLLLQLWFLRGSVFFPPRIGDVLVPMAFFGTIGGVTALGSIKIAQRSLPTSTPVQSLEPDSDHTQLGSGSA